MIVNVMDSSEGSPRKLARLYVGGLPYLHPPGRSMISSWSYCRSPPLTDEDEDEDVNVDVDGGEDVSRMCRDFLDEEQRRGFSAELGN